MIPQMTNEQFALWIASIKFTNSSDVIRIADKYYEWLESKSDNNETGWSDHMKEYLADEITKYDGVKTIVVNRRDSEQELIKKILDDRSNANGHDSNGNPKYIYEGYEYILNESCNKILAMSFEKIK